MSLAPGRLSRVVLDGQIPSQLPPALEADRAQAVADLAADNHFVPLAGKAGGTHGPFVLHLSVADGRLVFDIRRSNGSELTAIDPIVAAVALGAAGAAGLVTMGS